MFRLLFFTSLLLLVPAEEWHEIFAKNLRSKRYTQFEQLENWKAAMVDNKMTVACSDRDDEDGDQIPRDLDILDVSWKDRRCTIRFPRMKPNADGVLEPTEMKLQDIFRLLWGFAKLPVWKENEAGKQVRVEIELKKDTFVFRLQRTKCGQIMVYDSAGQAHSYAQISDALDAELKRRAKEVSVFLPLCFRAQFHSKRMQPFVAFFLLQTAPFPHLIPQFEHNYFEFVNTWLSTILTTKQLAGEIDMGRASDHALTFVSMEYAALVGVSHHHVHKNKLFVQQFPTCEVLDSQFCH